MIAFVDKHNLLSENQYGFRNKRSTCAALIELIDQITNSIDKNKTTIGIFIDLRKAFDTINHELLLKKLDTYGIRGIVNGWVKSYLSNRDQYVKYNGTNSDKLEVLCGVPQGSILGPLLFILFINDLCNVSELINFILFADDTNLFASGNNVEKLCRNINRELVNLNDWFMLNKLSLNVQKTNFILFGKTNKLKVSIDIAGENIEQVQCTKFLGVLVDENLNWKNHITYLKQKLSKCIGIVYRSRFFAR
jgi:retron-type reverse transcriptase